MLNIIESSLGGLVFAIFTYILTFFIAAFVACLIFLIYKIMRRIRKTNNHSR